METKKFFLTLVLSLLLWPCLQAQDSTATQTPRHYIQFSVGDPMWNSLWYLGYSCVDCRGNSYDWFTPDTYNTDFMLPTLSLSYHYAVKPWLLLGGEFYYEGYYVHNYDKITDEYLSRDAESMICILPSIRFQYLNRPNVGLYSGMALGLHVLFDNRYGRDTVYYLPGYQLTAFGVRFGNRVYGNFEIGFGNKGFFNLGIGARF